MRQNHLTEHSQSQLTALLLQPWSREPQQEQEVMTHSPCPTPILPIRGNEGRGFSTSGGVTSVTPEWPLGGAAEQRRTDCRI